MEADESDEGEEWEEHNVFVELIGMVDPDKLALSTKENTAILGLGDDELTVIKLGGYIFGGKYEEAIGTKVFFEEKEEKELEYFCHTTKILKTSRAFLKPKVFPEDKNENEDKNMEKEKTTGDVESLPAVLNSDKSMS